MKFGWAAGALLRRTKLRGGRPQDFGRAGLDFGDGRWGASDHSKTRPGSERLYVCVCLRQCCIGISYNMYNSSSLFGESDVSCIPLLHVLALIVNPLSRLRLLLEIFPPITTR